jgi:hypothetical protein
MGFIVSQSILSSTWGELDSFYTRIENYRLNKIDGRVEVTVMSYLDREKAVQTYPEYKEDTPPKSYLLGGLIEYNSQSIDLNEYNHFKFYLTSSVEILEDITEERYVSESFMYTDFDDEGNLVEREGWTDPKLTNVKIGETRETKTKIDLSPITGSIYSYTYIRVMGEYSKIFGQENIIGDV